MTSPRVDGVTQQIRGARRNIAGLYPESTLGRLAIDGESLDEGHRGLATSRAWRDPRCPLGQCWLPEKVRLVPPDRRRCIRHGQAILPADDPFPLEGEERRLAELDAWHAAMPKYHVPIIYADVSFESRLPTPAIEG